MPIEYIKFGRRHLKAFRFRYSAGVFPLEGLEDRPHKGG
jgi:hypothetical protein